MTPSLKTLSKLSALALAAVFVASCSSSSSSGGIAPARPSPDPVIGPGESLPGVQIEVLALRGGTGPNGNFRPGDVMTVDFAIKTDDGEALELVDLDRGAMMVSGPTFNYQRVIASQGDVLDRAIRTGIGRYSYTFAMPIPGEYLAPLNDSPAITDGELTGQALLSGTYTLGIELRKDYEVEGERLRDPGNVVAHFLLGDATQMDTREVVRAENCMQCHDEISVHGDNRTEVAGCLLCHTAGAEDRNVPSAAGGTPGVSIDFRVMIHKIHSGHSLPSVLGVTTRPDGTRDYSATPQPYEIVGFGDSVHDFSEVVLPMWPSFEAPMPADTGYGSLTGDQQDLEDTMRSGPVSCVSCHGDPDGSGPAPAPAQGNLAYIQPSRAACGSCHDDWVPERPYRSNGQTMPIQRDDASCKNCHREGGTPLDVRDAHLHPLLDPSVAPGINFEILSVNEVTGNGDGTFDAGEKLGITFRVADDAGTPIAPADIGRIEVGINGPTTNPNLLYFGSIDLDVIGPGPDHTIMLPENVVLEALGTSDSMALQTFSTARTPHWLVGGATYVFRRTATGSGSTLAKAADVNANYLDVASGDGAMFSAGDHIVIEDAEMARREFQLIQSVEGDRLWFSSPRNPTFGRPGRPISTSGVRFMHPAGSSVDIVTLEEVPAANYNLDPPTGMITETTEFGAGEILASYTTDFVVPGTYPGTLNGSPTLDETWGDWVGLPVLSGTYNVAVWGDRGVTFVNPNGNGPDDNTDYDDAGHAAVQPVLFGDADEIEVIDRISGAENCYTCHGDLQFHGGHRAGYETCLMCHGNAGAEDAPTYVYGNVTNNGVTIDFRTMIHKIHHGAELSKDYVIYGFRGSEHRYDEVHFPLFKGGTQNCTKCHGESDSWRQPAERNHPMQAFQTRSWRAACASCHDSNAAVAHIDANTAPNGGEACAICHGRGEDRPVDVEHTVR